ncbi:hypothetical protein HELRODRAFT_139567, partial [Helobdella robusta]|uniref:G-protein coupled receptors family 1 profile domain-containing protein n=1 Tax=Helobdella robusta TaxID=6412 RepID=T1EIZ1_HELRO
NTASLICVAIILTVIVVVMVLGNLLVIISLARFKHLRTVSNSLIGNLAASDFLLAITVLPFSSVNECLGRWVFGRITCNFWLMADVMYCTASIWNICVIALDRYTATLFPLWYRERRSNKQACLYVGAIWMIAVVTCAPPLFGWNDLSKNYQGLDNLTGHIYVCLLFDTPSYVIYSACVSFYIPFLLTVLLYVQIFIVLRKRLKLIREKNSKRKAVGMMAWVQRRPTKLNLTGAPKVISNIRIDKRQRADKREIRATIRMAVVIAAFCTMWIGFFTLYLIEGVCKACIVPKTVGAFVFWLGYTNSAINPILYAIFNVEFRKAFKKVLGI